MLNNSFSNKSMLTSVTDLKQHINTAFGDLKQKNKQTNKHEGKLITMSKGQA